MKINHATARRISRNATPFYSMEHIKRVIRAFIMWHCSWRMWLIVWLFFFLTLTLSFYSTWVLVIGSARKMDCVHKMMNRKWGGASPPMHTEHIVDAFCLGPYPKTLSVQSRKLVYCKNLARVTKNTVRIGLSNSKNDEIHNMGLYCKFTFSLIYDSDSVYCCM